MDFRWWTVDSPLSRTLAGTGSILGKSRSLNLARARLSRGDAYLSNGNDSLVGDGCCWLLIRGLNAGDSQEVLSSLVMNLWESRGCKEEERKHGTKVEQTLYLFGAEVSGCLIQPESKWDESDIGIIFFLFTKDSLALCISAGQKSQYLLVCFLSVNS